MRDREYMERAIKALENGVDVAETIIALKDRVRVLKEQEDWYSMPKETRDKIRMSAMGNRNLWKPELDAKYEKAKELRACGLTLRSACEKVGMTTDQWYRRQRIEKHGKSRDKAIE